MEVVKTLYASPYDIRMAQDFVEEYRKMEELAALRVGIPASLMLDDSTTSTVSEMRAIWRAENRRNNKASVA